MPRRRLNAARHKTRRALAAIVRSIADAAERRRRPPPCTANATRADQRANADRPSKVNPIPGA
jgi:hypothetical protein